MIGAGIGGLAAAVELAARGLDVTVVERAEKPGGKLRHTVIGESPIDAGPTVFTMRHVFDDLFAVADASFDDYVRVKKAETFARHAWSMDERLDLHADVDRSADAVAAFAGPAEAQGYRAFCKRAGLMYKTLEHTFMLSQRPSTPFGLVARAGLRGLPDMARITPYTTMWQEICRHFRDPRLRQLFGRYATYCGSSPFLTPGILMLIAHVEQDGVWLIEGGMYRLVEAVRDLAVKCGVTFRYAAHVEEILVRSGRACGIRLAGDEILHTDAVVSNTDAAALSEGRLGKAAQRAIAPIPRERRSLSALTWAIKSKTGGFPLLHHNVFFAQNYSNEFDDIFKHRRLPENPSVYVCAQDRQDTEDHSPDGPERLFLIVNAPPRGDTHPLETSEIEQCEKRTFALLERLGLHIQRTPETSVRTTPAQFESLFPATGGGLYGQATHGMLSAFRRPKSKSRIPGLYLAGGSVHPGPGVTMSAQSGRLAAQRLLADHDLIKP